MHSETVELLLLSAVVCKQKKKHNIFEAGEGRIETGNRTRCKLFAHMNANL